MITLYNVIVSSKIRSSILLKFSEYELFDGIKNHTEICPGMTDLMLKSYLKMGVH